MPTKAEAGGDGSVSIPPSEPADPGGVPGSTLPGRSRTLVLVHGGGFKPARAELERLWRDALAAGLDRDFADAGGRDLLSRVRVELVYYGDLVQPLLAEREKSPDPALDLADRQRDLARLSGFAGKKPFRRAQYEALPGKSAFGELVADVALPVLTALRLADPVLARQVPALAAYLSGKSDLRAACEARVLTALTPLLQRGDDVLLLSHAMGSVLCYDALWRLSHEAAAPHGRIDTWITCGSPLAGEYVKSRLRGAGEAPERRYPNNLVSWHNIAAEDDFYCHDKTVSDDYGALLKGRRISQIRDYRIYNVAMRYGRSNPHNDCGYLVHPRTTGLLAGWLTRDSGAAPGR